MVSNPVVHTCVLRFFKNMQQSDPLKKVVTFNKGTLHEKNLEEHIVIHTSMYIHI
jgi:hypothetical protein